MELNDKYKHSVITFKIIELKKDGKFIILDLENISEDFYKRNDYIDTYYDKSIPIFFTYYSVDDLNENQNKHIITDTINDNNIFIQYVSIHFNNKYKLYIDLTKHDKLRNKIYTLDYTLKCYYTNSNSFIIILDYTPNMRKIKIQKLKSIINKNKESNEYFI